MVRRKLTLGLLLLLLAAGQATAATEPGAAPAEDDYYELYKLLVDTMDQVERNYVKPVDRRELVEAAIEGVLTKLDPYSSYIGPERMGRFRGSVENEFGGIGIQVGMENGRLQVISPLVGTPGYRAGLIAGDWIAKIDGQPTEGLTLDAAIERLKGKPGTAVNLSVVHPGATEEVDVAITREIIHVQTVLGDHRNADDTWNYLLDSQRRIAYIRLTAFGRSTPKELTCVLRDLTKEKLRGLILDLRFNPGGLLHAAIEISDRFVASGTIVSTDGRNSPKRTWEAEQAGTFEGFPMVVLVNRYSASASEIVAACLQDHQRAVVIGERTWGKGSVQNVIELEGGDSALKLTTASYHRPSGKNIHRFADAKETDEWGVLPNEGFELKLDTKEMLAVVEDRRQRDIVRPHLPETEPRQPKADDPASQAEAESAADRAADAEADAGTEPESVASTQSGSAVDRQLRKALEYLSDELARAK